MISKKERHILVTGGSSGIGAEILRHFTENGYIGHLIYNSGEERARKIQKDATEKGQKIEIYYSDISDAESVQNVFSQINTKTDVLDVLVHSAVREIPKPIDEATFAEWRTVLGVKLDGAFLITKYFVPFTKLSEDPSIVYITSIDGEKPDGDYIAYQIATAGLIAMTKAQAVYLARKANIRVNAVAPGPTPSPLWTVAGESPEMWAKFRERTPIGRVAQANDVARACFFLANDQGAFLNGAFLDVDGGLRWA